MGYTAATGILCTPESAMLAGLLFLWQVIFVRANLNCSVQFNLSVCWLDGSPLPVGNSRTFSPYHGGSGKIMQEVRIYLNSSLS
jgi:hypothetical protein